MGIGGEVLQIGQDIMCYRWFATDVQTFSALMKFRVNMYNLR